MSSTSDAHRRNQNPHDGERIMRTAALQTLFDQAKDVLQGNWLGYATKPAPRLYPHQWSWEAAFIAMAYAHYDSPRAIQEMRSLFEGQWQNGLLPHIIFNQEARDYSPGPEFLLVYRSA